ncbi:MAG: sensor histidine kinase [Bacteroidetes bacterium SW_7_64_58]|nr:MAG: sensor histidine kinase [Bacteroidetes bacterium QH_6_64_77]PSQ94977.1 MAG: sensor histidine kinase [Bacteroidetes bacterium SW_7_64_58]
MAASAPAELSALRRFTRRYLRYGTAGLLVALVLIEGGGPWLVDWFRTTPGEQLWGRLLFAFCTFAVGLWTRLHLWALLLPVVLWLFRWADVRARLKRGVGWVLLIGVPVAVVHVAVERGIFAVATLTRGGIYPSFTTSFDFRAVDPYGIGGWRLAVFLVRRFIADYFTYFIVAALCFAYEHFLRSRQQEEQTQALQAELAQAQLQALRMQVNPHFLFNTLNAIAVLVRGGETSKAGRTLRLLSDMLRATFKGADVQMAPLREEIDLVERYLEIEEIRFGDRLRVEIEVDPDVSEVPVPYLLLQPLVENAVRHGIAPHAEAGVVRVSARPTTTQGQKGVELVVADSGSGFPKDPETLLAESEGVGLANTKRRLETLYGDAHTLELGTAAEGGARVTLQLPLDAGPDQLRPASEQGTTTVPAPES